MSKNSTVWSRRSWFGYGFTDAQLHMCIAHTNSVHACQMADDHNHDANITAWDNPTMVLSQRYVLDVIILCGHVTS